jgi:hypothetical protein
MAAVVISPSSWPPAAEWLRSMALDLKPSTQLWIGNEARHDEAQAIHLEPLTGVNVALSRSVSGSNRGR